jgi:hypothetical protein
MLLALFVAKATREEDFAEVALLHIFHRLGDAFAAGAGLRAGLHDLGIASARR